MDNPQEKTSTPEPLASPPIEVDEEAGTPIAEKNKPTTKRLRPPIEEMPSEEEITEANAEVKKVGFRGSGWRPKTIDGKDGTTHTVLTDRQEKYCRLRIEGFSRQRAYTLVYGEIKFPAQAAHLLELRPHVQLRMAELQEERAHSAKLVDPAESLARWNDIYQQALIDGDRRSQIEAQKQIDKINGAEKSTIRLEQSANRAEIADDWRKEAERLFGSLGLKALEGVLDSPAASERKED